MDLISVYMDNQATINLLIGVVLAVLAGADRYALKDNIGKTHRVLEELDIAMADDKITLEEQQRILERAKELVGEGFLMMFAKALTGTK